MIVQPARFFLICQWTSYAGGSLETLDQILPCGMQFTRPFALEADELAPGLSVCNHRPVLQEHRFLSHHAPHPLYSHAGPQARPRRRHTPCSSGKGRPGFMRSLPRSRCGSRGSHEPRGGRKRGQETDSTELGPAAM